jgi:hypothetical protein
MTDGQGDRLYDRFIAKLRKSGLPKAPTQYVLENEGDELTDEMVTATRRRVEARIRAAEPHILQRKPFDPVEFFEEGWTIDERIGQRTGYTLDAGKIVRKDYLKEGEFSINGGERIFRIKANPADIQLDGEDFLALYQEEGQNTLCWLYDTQGITWLSFWGIILRDPCGSRRVLYLYRRDDGSWYLDYRWVDYGLWYAKYPLAVLAS